MPMALRETALAAEEEVCARWGPRMQRALGKMMRRVLAGVPPGVRALQRHRELPPAHAVE